MSAAALTVDQGAALLWLRRTGGLAGLDWDGCVKAGHEVCPLLLSAFRELGARGLISVDLLADISAFVAVLELTGPGAAVPIEPESERRLDALLRRFND